MALPSDVLRARHGSALSRRTVQSHAAFLLPHLRPGLTLLDLGCGPGTITLGLAEAVAPGPTYAVDLEPGLPPDHPQVKVMTADAARLPLLVAGFDLMRTLRTGSPFVGRELRGLLAEAGFERCAATARAVHHGTAEEARGFAAFNATWFTTPAIVDRMVAGGVATADELAATGESWLRWGEQPGAFYAGLWCGALAWAPD